MFLLLIVETQGKDNLNGNLQKCKMGISILMGFGINHTGGNYKSAVCPQSSFMCCSQQSEKHWTQNLFRKDIQKKMNAKYDLVISIFEFTVGYDDSVF